ncbi:MAG TPA: hypothetical protein VHL30_02905, partial [Chlamydiales bacterium]|nr:hypothetical protein [Chlamydiales bacterium]
VALGCFEAIVHWFLTTFSCCFCSYNKLYQEALASTKHFSDGTVIKDLTAGKIVSVISERPDLAVTYNTEYIALNNCKVLFSLNGVRLFGKNDSNTDHIVVEDSTDQPGEIIITEYERTGNVKVAIVNKNFPLHRADTGNVYLIKEIYEQCRRTREWHEFYPPQL